MSEQHDEQTEGKIIEAEARKRLFSRLDFNSLKNLEERCFCIYRKIHKQFFPFMTGKKKKGIRSELNKHLRSGKSQNGHLYYRPE